MSCLNTVNSKDSNKGLFEYFQLHSFSSSSRIMSKSHMSHHTEVIKKLAIAFGIQTWFSFLFWIRFGFTWNRLWIKALVIFSIPSFLFFWREERQRFIWIRVDHRGRSCSCRYWMCWCFLNFSFGFKKVWNLKSKVLAWSLKVDLVVVKHQDVEIICVERTDITAKGFTLKVFRTNISKQLGAKRPLEPNETH